MSGDDDSSEALGAELEARLLRRLGVEWRAMNYRYFRAALRAPILALADHFDSPIARWVAPSRTLELAREAVLRQPWPEVLEGLKRAAVWQYVDERLSVDPRNRYPSYRRICRHLGIVSIEGEPAPADALAHEDPRRARSRRVVRRIHKLLALARSPNQHEAEAAATTARRLMFKFNIEHDEAGLDEHRGDASEDEGYAYRHLGSPRGPLREHDRRLAKILTDFFFVHSAWLPVYLPRSGKRGVVLEICGLEANLLMAEHVHDFLRQTAARLWQDDRARAEQVRPGDREAFLAGVMSGFESKLARQDQSLREQGLVWVPAPGLGQYFRRRHPGIAYTHVGAGAHGVAYERGSRAGRQIVLSQPVTTHSTTSGRPRALGPARSS